MNGNEWGGYDLGWLSALAGEAAGDRSQLWWTGERITPRLRESVRSSCEWQGQGPVQEAEEDSRGNSDDPGEWNEAHVTHGC